MTWECFFLKKEINILCQKTKLSKNVKLCPLKRSLIVKIILSSFFMFRFVAFSQTWCKRKCQRKFSNFNFKTYLQILQKDAHEVLQLINFILL